MPLPEFSGVLGLKRASHLLRRATFGASKPQIDSFAGLPPQQAVNLLFRQALPDPVLPVDPQTGTEWFLSGTTDANSRDSDLEEFFLCWFIGQMMSNGVPANLSLAYSAREKLVFFLHSHFTAIRSKIANSRALYFQNQLFRQFALDALNPDPLVNFKNLTVKVSVDNAMLRLLDGNLNVKGSPNENYARELFELYSCGRGLEGTLPATPATGDYIIYTEQDIQAAAKVLSGWDFDEDFANIDPDTNLPRGRVKGSPANAASHDNSVKTFSPRMGNATITPDPLLLGNNGTPTEASALDEVRQLVDVIYANPETARNICRKIYRFFVWAPHTLDETMPIEPIISEMVNTFVASNYKLQPVIENLLRSQHFYEAAGGVTDDNFGSIIKSPLDLSIGTLRLFEVTLPDMITQAETFYEHTGEVLGAIENMGMHFYEPYDVAGYEAYHQFPVYHRFWITPNSLTRRYEFVRNLISSMEPGMIKINVYDYVERHFAAQAPNAGALIIALIEHFYPVFDNLDFDDATDSGLTARRMNFFRDQLFQGLTNDDDAYWTQRWNEGAGDLREQLEFLFNALLQTPEYQLA